MATLDLTGQAAARNLIAPKLLQLKQLMDQRKLIWDKIRPHRRLQWVQSDKDAIMAVAVDVYRYLYNFYDGVDPNDYT